MMTFLLTLLLLVDPITNAYGDWWQANQAMDAALGEKGYHVDFLGDRGFHACWSCGMRLPQALRKTRVTTAP